MPMTRRQALAAAVGCGLTSAPVARADEKPSPTREPLRRISKLKTR